MGGRDRRGEGKGRGGGEGRGRGLVVVKIEASLLEECVLLMFRRQPLPHPRGGIPATATWHGKDAAGRSAGHSIGAGRHEDRRQFHSQQPMKRAVLTPVTASKQLLPSNWGAVHARRDPRPRQGGPAGTWALPEPRLQTVALVEERTRHPWSMDASVHAVGTLGAAAPFRSQAE